MSTKTLRKRIALVAVSAMGFGLLTSVGANAAVATAEHVYLGTTASTSGSANIDPTDVANTTSVGLVVASSADLSAAATATGVALSTAKLAISVKSAAHASIVVSSGKINAADATTTAHALVSGDLSTVVNVTNGDVTTASVSPTGAVGSTMTISAYAGANVTATAPTAGSLLGTWSFTIAASNATGIASTANSSVYIQAPIAKSATQTGTNAYDSSNVVQNGQAGVAYITIKDAYKAAVTTGTLAASATNGATVILKDTAAAGAAYTATSSFNSITNTDGLVYLVVNQPVANTAGTTTVTVSLDGVVLGTKTWNFYGDIASLTVDTANSATTFINGYALATPITVNPGAIGNIVYVAKDAAGNAVDLTAQPTLDSTTGAMVGATVYTGNTAANGGNYQLSAVGYGYTTVGWAAATTLKGAGSYRLKLTNSQGVAIYSAVQNVTVSNGGPDSFAIAWDKSTYNPGDLATLTITVKDAYGNPVGAGTALPGLTAGLIVSTAGFTAVGTACTDTSATDSKGQKTCKFAAGNTEGAYSYSVDLNTADPQSPIVGTLKIASASTAVTNAEVLAAIVKLIASINKQIAALQKALTKKK